VTGKGAIVIVDSIQSTVKTYILQKFLPDADPDDLTPDTLLISDGILDSLATIKLVEFLEQKFGIQVEAHEVSNDNLETLNLIAKLVRGKQAGSTP
jgi:acyl carrier protein